MFRSIRLVAAAVELAAAVARLDRRQAATYLLLALDDVRPTLRRIVAGKK